jgi:hypothetical protein
MKGTALLAIFLAALSFGGDADARPLDGPASAAQGGVHMSQQGRAGKSRRSRARKRRKTATNANAGTRKPQTAPSGQPAHMAPQLEDVPPVKPPKTTPPKPDKRNPSQ